MKRWIKLFTFSVLTGYFAGCETGLFDDCTQGDGPAKTYYSSIEEFGKLVLKIPAKVILNQDSSATSVFVEVFCQPNVYENIGFQKSGDVLSIDFQNCVTQYQPVEIKLTYKDFNGLEIQGPSDLVTEDIFFVDSLDILLNSTSIFDASFRARKFSFQVDGAGEVALNGFAETFSLTHNSVGSVRAFNLETDSIFVDQNNAGIIEVTAQRSINAEISGVGEVFYKGTPTLFGDTAALISSN